MVIKVEPIAAATGKGRDEECDAMDQESFASQSGCRSSNVARVSEVSGQATATMTP